MEPDQSQLLPVRLPSGAVVYMEATVLDAEEEVALTDLPFQDVVDAIADVAGTVHGGLARLKPDKAQLEVNVQVGVESGKLSALFLKGSGSASLKVTLEWSNESKAQD